jgi:anti-sigma28 factor (negative regulator of flagellin synthesis)
VGKATPGSNSSAVNQSAAKATADVVPGPAVNLDISLTAKLAEVQSDSKANKASDQALIEKLRAKVAAGEFEIDYKQISQAMLKDVVAAIGQKPNSI